MVCSTTRGICAGGYDGSSPNNTIDYVTIATKGNATNFGDLIQARSNISGVASPVRVVFGGGMTPSRVDTMDYISIATQGDAIDFGNLSEARDHNAGCSNAHGGL